MSAGRRVAQDPRFTLGVRRQPLGRATQVKLQPLADSSCARHSLVNMEKECNSKVQSSVTYLTLNTDKYMLMPFAPVLISRPENLGVVGQLPHQDPLGAVGA